MEKSIQIKICPTCGGGKIKKVRRNWSGRFQGQSYSVPSLEFHECSECGEKVYDREAMRRIEEESPAFIKSRKQKHAMP